MSVAGMLLSCICAAAAAASNALIPFDAEAHRQTLPPDETAFMRPFITVDFSACVAPTVRK